MAIAITKLINTSDVRDCNSDWLRKSDVRMRGPDVVGARIEAKCNLPEAVGKLLASDSYAPCCVAGDVARHPSDRLARCVGKCPDVSLRARPGDLFSHCQNRCQNRFLIRA